MSMNKRVRERLGFTNPDVFRITPMGAYEPTEGKRPQLLYSFSEHRPRNKICNILQVSGTILGQSK